MNLLRIEQPLMAPGCCFLTLTHVGPFIDTGIDLDDLPHNAGRIILSKAFVDALAQQFGYAAPEAWDRAVDQTDSLRARVAELEEAVDALTAVNGALVARGFTPSSPPVTADIEQVLSWVRSDPTRVRVRALEAAEAETLEPRPRTSLLVALGEIVKAQEAQDADTVPV